MFRTFAFCLLVLVTTFASGDLFGSDSASSSNKILIVHDELPQMEVLAKFLREEGGLNVTIVEQSALPQDWTDYRAVIAYIHRVLEAPTEKAIIFMPGHAASDFEDRNISQMILNAITWEP